MAKYLTLKQRKSLRNEARPKVKALVSQYGRTTVAFLLHELQNKERVAAKIAALRKEARELARKG